MTPVAMCRHVMTRREEFEQQKTSGSAAPSSYNRALAKELGCSVRVIEECVQIGRAFSSEELDTLEGLGLGKLKILELSRRPVGIRQMALRGLQTQAQQLAAETIAKHPPEIGHTRTHPKARRPHTGANVHQRLIPYPTQLTPDIDTMATLFATYFTSQEWSKINDAVQRYQKGGSS